MDSGEEMSKVVFITTVTILEKPKETREVQKHVLKSREIDKIPGEREKVNESGSLPLKPEELAGLHCLLVPFKEGTQQVPSRPSDAFSPFSVPQNRGDF